MLVMPLLLYSRYDVAISTACAALDYIVVESTSDAQRCVKLLHTYIAAAACSVLCYCRYDVAISTACAALDYIVVDSTSDAQRCVELLHAYTAAVAALCGLDCRYDVAISTACAALDYFVVESTSAAWSCCMLTLLLLFVGLLQVRCRHQHRMCCTGLHRGGVHQ
jgi:chromosome segregation ATPase